MASQQLSRRAFIAAAGTVACQGVVLGSPFLSPTGTMQPACCLRVRQNILCLTACQLASLKRGIDVMKSRPVSDPTSWIFQANIHGTFDALPDPLWSQCEHGTIQFLSWHRAYLYYFERILRAASGDPCLTLPYWNWSVSPELPLAYRQPGSASNPLYDGTRAPAMNAGGSLPPNVVGTSIDDALSEIDFWPWPAFSPKLEGPHGTIHVLIGGNMGSVPTAARDPIFWLHHGNIDRLWDYWLSMAGGRANSADASFLDQEYSLVDECRQTVTFKIRDYLHSSCLGYRYDDLCFPPTKNCVFSTQILPQIQVLASSTGDGTLDAPLAEMKTVPLRFEPHRAKLAFVDNGAELLKTAVGGSSRVVVDIQGIHVADVPNFTYGIYLNLPDEKSDAEKKSSHYLGAIDFFGHGHRNSQHAGHMPESFNQRFDATKVIARLRQANRWNQDEPTITFLPLTSTAPKSLEAAQVRLATESAAKAQPTYQRVLLYQLLKD